jgi:hypothetical protein
MKELTPGEREALGIGDIKLNRAKCLLCQDIIVSRNRHDFTTCKCGNLSVDGGSWYLKRCFKEIGQYEELSENYKELSE